jgi:hypothetical protein
MYRLSQHIMQPPYFSYEKIIKESFLTTEAKAVLIRSNRFYIFIPKDPKIRRYIFSKKQYLKRNISL